MSSSHSAFNSLTRFVCIFLSYVLLITLISPFAPFGVRFDVGLVHPVRGTAHLQMLADAFGA